MSPAAADFSQPISSSRPVSQNPNFIHPSSNNGCGPQSSLNFADKVSNGGLSFDFSNKGSNFVGQSRAPRVRHTVKKMKDKVSVSENKDCSDVLRNSVNLNRGSEASVSANSVSGSLRKKGGGGGDVGVDSIEVEKFGKVDSVFGADGCSLGSSFAFGTNKSSSTVSFSNGSYVFGASIDNSDSNLNNRGADRISSGANSSVFNADESSSILKGKGASLFGADTDDLMPKSSLRTGSFVCGSSVSCSGKNSNLGHTNSTATLGRSGAHESRKFDNVGFVFGAQNRELASDSGLEQKCSNNNCNVQSGANDSEKFRDMGFVSGGSRTTVKLDAGEFSKRDGYSSFATSVSTKWNLSGQKDHSGFSLGASRNYGRSQLGKSRIRRFKGKLNFISQGKNGTAAEYDFQQADTNSNYGFGNRTKASSSSIDNSDNSNETIKLDTQKAENRSAAVKWPSDAVRSSFKFVIGSDSSPGSAFYKVPLSKLFDDMKGLNIDNSKGINGADESKVGASNSQFHTDKMFSFESNDLASSPVSEKENQISNSSEKISIRNMLNQELPIHDNNLNKTSQTSVFSSRAAGHVKQNGFGYDTSSTKTENKGNFCSTSAPVEVDACSREFKYEPFSFMTSLFPGLSENSRYTSDKRLRRTRGKLKQRVLAKNLNKQDQMSKVGSSPKTFESPGCNSPMDFSPYQDANKRVPSFGCTSVATEKKEENVSPGRPRSDINECDKRPGKQDVFNSEIHQEGNSKYDNRNGLSAIRRQYRKKYKLKVCNGLNGKTSVQKSDALFTSAQFSSDASHPFCMGESQAQNGGASTMCSKAEGQHVKQDSSDGVMNGECDQWRMRGNQAYKIRDLSKAEKFYTNGINSVRRENVQGFYIEPLLLCYSNRAATRMSLGRLRDALEDCKTVAALDPSFLKAKLRAANCHLVLGEFQEAIQYFNHCLESGNAVCLDRKIVIEAGEGLQKAQKAAEYMCESANILQQRTSDAANCALEKIVEGLSTSCYSERFLEMKGEALFLLRRYDEVIELCEQTLNIAEKNFSGIQLANESDLECKKSVRLWRWHLMSKSQFHLGRLEVALDLIEKQENLTSPTDWSSSVKQESLIPLAATIRELLHRKKAGNDAFQSGKHMEAVEHYTAAISISVDSRPFAAICFCNRAAAYQALGLIADAIADCCVAIALDGDYLKAVSRRATLHEMIRDYKQAITDLQKLISLLEIQSQEKAQRCGKLEGSNGRNDRELKRAQRHLSLMEDKAKQGTPMDFYLILGIKASDAESEIKKAYRKAALKHHPDKASQFLAKTDGGDDGRSWKDILEKVHKDADRLFKMIGEAYAVLSDPDKRAKYNYEEEIRKSCSDSKSHSDSGRASDYYNSPSDKGHWPGRQQNFSSSTFERSRSRRYWQESWKSYANSHARW